MRIFPINSIILKIGFKPWKRSFVNSLLSAMMIAKIGVSASPRASIISSIISIAFLSNGSSRVKTFFRASVIMFIPFWNDSREPTAFIKIEIRAPQIEPPDFRVSTIVPTSVP